MRLFDTHCHLSIEPLSKRLDAVLSRAYAVGVDRFMVPAFDLASWSEVEALHGFEGVFCALGLHPWAAEEKLDPAELEERLIGSGCRAMGEIGLDYEVQSPSKGIQKSILERQLSIACDIDLPVLLHCRKAFDDLLSLVLSFSPGLRGVLHAFSRSPEVAGPFLEAGLHIAFGGAVTRAGARRARASAAMIPPDRILFETDAPSIGMEGLSPLEVEPCHLVRVAEAVAAIRGTTPGEIAVIATANAVRLFGVPES